MGFGISMAESVLEAFINGIKEISAEKGSGMPNIYAKLEIEK